LSVFKKITNPNVKPLNPKIDRRTHLGSLVKAAWPLSDAIGVQGNPSSGIIYDVAGRGFHGTTTDLNLVHTPYGFGVDFGSGDSEHIEIDTTILKSQQFTYMVLIKFGAVNENQVIFQNADASPTSGWTFQIRSDGKLEYNNHSTDGISLTGTQALFAGEWYRIGFSVGSDSDEVNPDPPISIYIDGVEDVYHAGLSGDLQELLSYGDVLTIGKETHVTSNGLTNAVIADITAYNSFLSEIEAQYEWQNLFETYYQNLPLAFSGLESVGGGVLVGGSSPASTEITETVGGGVLLGGKAPEEPPVSGGVVLGGAVTEESSVEASGGILVGGIALEAKEVNSSGGLLAGGSAPVTAVYNPQFPSTDTTEGILARTGTNLGPFNDWSDTHHITLGTDTFAYANLEDSPTAKSSLLIASNFNLAMPTGLVPLGIEVFIEANTDNSTRGVFNRIYLTKDGSNSVGDEKTDNVEIGQSQTIHNYGGSGDLWGTTWTAAEINSSNFGFAIEVLSDPGTGTVQADVYQMKVQITAVDINHETMGVMGGEGSIPQTYNETVSGGLLAGGVGFHSEGEVEEAGGGILVGGVVPELMAFDPLPVGGMLAGGEGIEEIGNLASGGALLGGRAFTVYDEVGVGGVVLRGAGEVAAHIVKGGASGGGSAVVGIQPPASGGVILGGLSITGFADFGGVILNGSVGEVANYSPTASNGGLIGGVAEAFSSEAFIPTGGMLVGGTAIPTAEYNLSIVGGALLGGNLSEEPPISGGIILGGVALSFVDQQASGGALIGGEGIEEIALLGFGRVIVGGSAIVQEIQEEPVSGGVLVSNSAIVEITPFHEGGMLAGGTALVTAVYTVDDIGTGGALIGGFGVAGIQPPASGGMLVGGEAFDFITEIGLGGALIGGFGSQTYYEVAVGGAILGGLSESSIDYNGHGGALIGGLALVSDEIIKHPSGGALIGGLALVSDEIIKYASGGAQVSAFTLFHYNFIGGVNFDDTVSYGGPITIGGEASVVRPTIKFIGDGPVVIGGSAEASFEFSDFEFESQTPVSTPVAIGGVADVILTIEDQYCITPDKPCKISDRQTGQRRIHCTTPELFAPYCGDLRRGNQCSNDAALLPAIIACRQKLLVQQEVLDIKNKTVLRNRGNVI
jgi:hypothetical protein